MSDLDPKLTFNGVELIVDPDYPKAILLFINDENGVFQLELSPKQDIFEAISAMERKGFQLFTSKLKLITKEIK